MNVEARLRAFAAVARTGSFSRAAETLYVSQPAVSKHVSSLEAELGTKLMVRGRGGASLTPAGQVLADYVLRAEALLVNARRALAAGADAQIGTLALAASGTPGTYVLPDVLARFHEQHPGVELDLRISTSGGALELLRAHDVELAIVGGMTVPPELESEPLLEDEIVLIGPPSLAGRRLRARDLEQRTWISREEGSATRAAVEAARWQLGLRAVRTLELPSWEAVKLAVASGAGVAAISRRALALELESGSVAVLDVARWRLSRTIAVVRAQGVPLTPPAERFLQLLRATVRPGADELDSRSSLPAPPELLGRESELAHVAEALEHEQLVTLSGAGGNGKTSLAIAAAAQILERYGDGVFFVDLSPLTQPARVVEAVEDVVGVRRGSSLRERLTGSSTLLVLDNFEHLLEAAPEIERIVSEHPGVRVLVTSRAPLHVRGVYMIDVPPLTLEDAVTLFMRTARKAGRRIARSDVVAELCERLDRLPLAIELAAARLNVFAPEEILERLRQSLDVLSSPRRDVDARHRTLRATLEWSFGLLRADARTALARLSVFAGGWTIAAAEEVCSASAESLAELVDHSLVRRDDDRFRMLDTVHAYATGLLSSSGDREEISRRHALYFAALAEAAEPHLTGPLQGEWLARLRAEAENVRAAVEWADGARERELQLRIAGSSWRFWLGLSGREQWATWLESALGDVEDPRSRLCGLAPLGWLALEAGDLARAEHLGRERLALALSVGDDRHAGGAYSLLSLLASHRGDATQALELGRDAVEADRRGGLQNDLAFHLSNLAGVLVAGGDLAGAKPLLEESGEIAAAVGNALHAADVEFSLATIELRQGEGAAALGRVVRALPTFIRLGRAEDVWVALEIAGASLVAAGRPSAGAVALAASERARTASGQERDPTLARVRDEALRQASDALGAEALAEPLARGDHLSPQEVADLVLAEAGAL